MADWVTESESRAMVGDTRYTGWGKAEAAADMNAKGLTGKGGGGGSNDLLNLQSMLNPEIDKYADELIKFANEDYDFAAKWLETQFKIALGNDDQERANFIKSVANELESKVGTIAYDYQTGKYRTERDRDVALARLDEDERVAKEELDIQAGKVREIQGASLNERGILTGTREGVQGLAGKNVRKLETDIGRRYAALDRLYNRNVYDVKTEAEDTLADLMTTARRGAANTQYAYDYGKEQADRAKKRAILAAEGERLGVKSDLFGALSSYYGNLG